MKCSAPAWEQREEESPRAYEGFRSYLCLGAARSLEKAWVAYRQSQDRTDAGPLQSYYKQWSSRHGWVQRARAYDEHLHAIEFEQREARARERSLEAIDMEWELALALRRKVLELLRQPLSEFRLSLRDAEVLSEAASRLARRSVGDYGAGDVLRGTDGADQRPLGIEIVPPPGFLIADPGDDLLRENE